MHGGIFISGLFFEAAINVTLHSMLINIQVSHM